MAEITGAVNLTGMIAPTDTTDVYPTHSSEYGKGGYREVANLIERDGIPSPRRVGGMLVTTQDTGKIYRLGSGLTNSDWTEVSMPDTTDALVEGANNLYYTDQRVLDYLILNQYTTEAYADQAEADAISAANLYTDAREIAITIAYQAYADQAETDAITAANLYTDTVISNLIDSAPGTLDTLNELAAALGDDPNFATTVTNNIATKVSKSGDTMTGPLVLSGPPTLGLHASTKDYVDSAVNSVSGTVSSLTTDDILEGTNNLYYTDARVDSRIPTNISSFSNDVGYITSYVDTNDYVDSATFSTISGNITLGRTGGLSDISVNLDGRYLKIGNAYDSWELRTDNTSRGKVDSLEAVNFISGDNITIGYNYNFENEITINAPTQISAFNNDVGYITGYTEVDTLDSVTSRGNITSNDITVHNLTVDGNLTVEGTTTTINAQELAIEDNLIYLNEGSTVTNPDLGWSGNYNDGTYRHAGMFRDATDGVFKAFQGYTPEPGQSIDTAHASFNLADLQVENLILNSSPTLGSHATSKSYVDSAVSSVSTTVGNLDTDDVPEGTSNLYYTDTRSRASISVSGSLGYDSNTGIISYTQPTNVSAFTNDSGYLTSYTETDPTVPSHVKSITTTEKSNWNTAFGWGDHSTQGYLTSYTETDPTVPSHVKSITTTEKSNWNTAFGWGDHSTQGYLTSETDSQTLTFNSPNLSISNGNTVNLSALLDDTDTNTYLQSLGFNTTNGVLTATLNDASTVTVDLDGRYSTTDTTYSQATSTTLGLVKIGYAENGKNYPVELSNGQMFVNVPWTDTNTDTDNYVDSVSFNTTNGILTLGRTGALADLTVDLDGRYLTSYTDTNDIDYINSASFNTTNGVLTLSGVGNAGATVDLDGRYQQIGDAPTAHTHTFDSLTSKTSGTGEYSTSSHLTSGRGSGGVSLTINDGYGNANVTWNHKSGTPEQNGNAARIEVNTDSTTNATMYFELGSGVTSGQAINLNAAMTLTETSAEFPGTVTSNGNTLATETYVNTQVANLVDSAPGTLDTLNELAAALGDDPNFATTITNSIATKQDAATALTTSTQFGGDVSGTYGAIVVANDSHTHSNYMTNNAATQFNVGRGAVYVENNSNDNVDGAGITVRSSSNPGTTTTSGGIFSVRSSGQGNRFWVGQGLTSSGANPFYVGGNSNVNSTGSANPANYAIELATNGTITATGDVCAYGTISDRRQKENVLKLENALDKVNQLNGYTFNYIGKEDRMTGVMAQEVAEVLPEAVFETKSFGAEETTMAVRHGNMVGLLIEAIKDLTEENKYLKYQIEEINKKLNL